MLNPEENEVAKIYHDIFHEEESDSDYGYIEEVETSIDIQEEMKVLIAPDSKCFILHENGSIVPMIVPDVKSAGCTWTSDSEDEEDEARSSLLKSISPVIPRLSCPESSVGAVLPKPVPAGNDHRRSTYRGGRRGCSGRARRAREYIAPLSERLRVRGSKGSNTWLRGQPYIERFGLNDELSEPLRVEIEQLTAQRERRRQHAPRVKVDLEEEESAFLDENEEYAWTSMDGWSGTKEPFSDVDSGPTRLVHNIYDAFRSYWDDSLVSHIVDETNRYAQTVQSERFKRDWYDTNVDEMLVFFAFWMMLGIIKMPTIKSCFTKHRLLRMDVFRSMLNEDRYWNLNRAFHLANGSQDTDDPSNVLHPMGPILTELNKKFKENYLLHQDICIDESLTLWKGQEGFKQYIATKSARFGIKTYQLCESSTGYLWSFFVDVGHRRTNNPTLSSSVTTVLKLIQPLLNMGHVLYMDSWFNSPTLARYLKHRRTDCVGPLRPSSKNVPAIIQMAPLAEGEFIARQCGDVMLVALQDRKRHTCLSTFHDVSQVQKPHVQFKLSLIDDYDHKIGGVDRMDQMLEPYLVERKRCSMWTKKLFKRLLNISIQNATILLQKSTNTKVGSFAVRLELVESILMHHRQNVPLRNPSKPPKAHISRQQFPSERLTERHFIRRIVITDEMRATVRNRTNRGRRQCVWCTANGRKQSRTCYECPQCKVPLCLDFCFEQFHTIP